MSMSEEWSPNVSDLSNGAGLVRTVIPFEKTTKIEGDGEDKRSLIEWNAVNSLHMEAIQSGGDRNQEVHHSRLFSIPTPSAQRQLADFSQSTVHVDSSYSSDDDCTSSSISSGPCEATVECASCFNRLMVAERLIKHAVQTRRQERQEEGNQVLPSEIPQESSNNKKRQKLAFNSASNLASPAAPSTELFCHQCGERVGQSAECGIQFFHESVIRH
eukprot:GHVH01000189.1.p1 GENE.GHVH01000189.1~~GHVH01000189.1.p1  ORF type:complete len:216 (-),score=31.33 GHVH01000189.1:241-888(-)